MSGATPFEYRAHSKILEKCDIAVENARHLPEEEFALARRNGLGASDMSVILGLQSKWSSPDDTLQLKLTREYTDGEREVANKPLVRKGKDLEPFILEGFQKKNHVHIWKPDHMYKMREYPYLTINFDGISMSTSSGVIFPVEAKLVSMFADKHWNWDLSGFIMDTPLTGVMNSALSTTDIMDHCEAAACIFGIPSYYYAQIQQQMMALDAPWGFFAALRDKEWELHSFFVPADEWLQRKLVVEGYQFWKKVEKIRHA